MIIKIILISGIVLIGLVALREKVSGSSLALRRLSGAGIIVVGTVLILWPDITTVLAEWVGVGRGTDLLFYGCILVFMFTTISQGQRLYRLEQRLVNLTRELAIMEARHDGSASVPEKASERKPD
jgi:hypothetical protein